MSTVINHNFPDWLSGSEGEDLPGRDATRNVIDHFAAWSTEEINDELRRTSYPVQLVLENFAHDFNIATAVRNANAFNVRGVTILGARRWDKRGAVGMQHYTDITYRQDPHVFYREIHDDPAAKLVVVDNLDGAVPLPSYDWNVDDTVTMTYIVFGQEQVGVSNVSLRHADDVVYIPQRGSVRSMNVGTTSGVILYDYMSKMSPGLV